MTETAMTGTDLTPMTPELAYELDRQHVFHSWSAQAQIRPMVVTKAEGSYIWDQDDNRLLDFTSQLVYTNLGHQHPRIVRAIQEQAATLCAVAPQHANATRSEAARLIASHTPEGLDRIFFTNGGADANEHAVRMARLHTGRPKVLSAYRSYHGGTQLAINMTGDQRRWANDSGSSGTVHFFGPFAYRSPVSLHVRRGGVCAGAGALGAGDRVRGRRDVRGSRVGDDPGYGGRAHAAAWLPTGRARVVRPLWNPADCR